MFRAEIVDTLDGAHATWQASTPDEINRLFTRLAQIYAFNDCDDSWDIRRLELDGRSIHYDGWAPDMYFSFSYDDTGETVWEGQFPQWEH